MIKLELPLDAVDLALTALGQRPYVQVVNLINEIQRQAAPQVQAMNTPAPTPPAAPEEIPVP